MVFFSHPKISGFCHKHKLWKDSDDLNGLSKAILSLAGRDTIKQILDECCVWIHSETNKDIQLVSIYDSGYPRYLKEIYDPPLVLAVRGNKEVLKKNLVSVVGTRKVSPVSRLATRLVVEKLKSEHTDLTIVSGMALGIDREAFVSALDLGIPVLGVLGTCMDQEYPPGNRDLYKRVKQDPSSCLVTEFVLKTEPARWTFPKRNRVISGLSLHVYIMESGSKSGTLSTAMSALSQNREIHVFDHPLQFDNSGGKNLLNDGANPILWEEIAKDKGWIHYPAERSDERTIGFADWKKEKDREKEFLRERNTTPLGRGAHWISIL
ncbi:DNA-processing protein DprA [Leptospira ilyithenensis]|uniref:DNA-processing protein DprA n=1 Tax=Leptospira ilyithenensis TaxID=2484901 RepID=A0A4R9LUJ3_9LEPT|nr:DNA-processing protein DprA [Leptospira ilyithenensis]